MRLEDKDQQVLASQIVRDIIKIADELLSDYNIRSGAVMITLDELRTRFLTQIISSQDAQKRTLITAFISFIAEWKYRARLIDLIEHGSREPFFLHIFRGCLLFESLLKANPVRPIPPGRHTLSYVLKETHAELGIPAKLDISSSDFDAEVQLLNSATSTTDAIQMTGKIRNTLGHNFAWPSTSLNQNRYSLAIKCIAAACIHAVSNLYS